MKAKRQGFEVHQESHVQTGQLRQFFGCPIKSHINHASIYDFTFFVSMLET